MPEEWRSIGGFPGYEVSDLGRVRRSRVVRGKPGGMLRSTDNGKGYRTVMLYREGTQSRHTVHGLVAAAFLGPRPALAEVNHRDLDRGNNARENLEYVTSSANKIHALEHGGGTPGERNPMARLTADVVEEIRRAPGTQREIARHFGISQGHVSDIRNRKRWARSAFVGV